MSGLTKNKELLLRKWLQDSEQHLVVLVFSASWSGSAHILYTYVKQVAQNIPKMHHYLIDIEEQPELAAHFGISQVPISIVLQKREIVDHIRGTISKKKLLTQLQKH